MANAAVAIGSSLIMSETCSGGRWVVSWIEKRGRRTVESDEPLVHPHCQTQWVLL